MQVMLKVLRLICRNTRGPIASICYQGLMRFDDGVEDVERSDWLMVPCRPAIWKKDALGLPCLLLWHRHSGFLGTVIGMVMAFDQIQQCW